MLFNSLCQQDASTEAEVGKLDARGSRTVTGHLLMHGRKARIQSDLQNKTEHGCSPT